MREMMDSGRMLSRIFMASLSSVSTPFTMDCTQVASFFTLRCALMRASSSPLFTGLLHAHTQDHQHNTVHGSPVIPWTIIPYHWPVPWWLMQAILSALLLLCRKRTTTQYRWWGKMLPTACFDTPCIVGCTLMDLQVLLVGQHRQHKLCPHTIGI